MENFNTEQLTDGIHFNIPFDTYVKWDALSNSKLSLFAKSPLHFKRLSNYSDSKTDSQIFGTAVHTAIFEPERFRREYIVKPEDINRRTKEGKEAYSMLVDQHGEDKILSSDDYQHIMGMQDSARSHPIAGQMLKEITANEVSLLWTRGNTQFKGRIDAIGKGILIDLKTTQSAESRKFQSSFFKYGYHRQAAFYLQGAKRLKLVTNGIVFIAIEKTPPYALALFQPSHGVITAAAAELESLILQYHQCKSSNQWPGYPEMIQDVSMPDWMTEEFTNLEGEENE